MTGIAFTATELVVLLQPEVLSVNVKLVFPTAIPVMTPALLTVATDGLLLDQVPPDEGVRVFVSFTQTCVGATTTGSA